MYHVKKIFGIRRKSLRCKEIKLYLCPKIRESPHLRISKTRHLNLCAAKRSEKTARVAELNFIQSAQFAGVNEKRVFGEKEQRANRYANGGRKPNSPACCLLAYIF